MYVQNVRWTVTSILGRHTNCNGSYVQYVIRDTWLSYKLLWELCIVCNARPLAAIQIAMEAMYSTKGGRMHISFLGGAHFQVQAALRAHKPKR